MLLLHGQLLVWNLKLKERINIYMTEQLKVAINAPISAETAGGVESNILSLIKQLSKDKSGILYDVLCINRHINEIIPFLGENQHAEVWPYIQLGHISYPEMDGRWGKLRKYFRKAERVIDIAYYIYKNSFLKLKRPTVKKSDKFLKDRGISVIHFPSPLFFDSNIPFLYEPWDLQHRHYPEFFSKKEFEWRDRLYYEGCRKAKLVITAANWIKKDIVKQFGIPPSKIAVIPRGSLMFHDRMPIKKRSDFAFYPAMTFPHKNHLCLLDAVARLRDEKNIMLPLICTGRFYEPHFSKLMQKIERLELEGQVHFLGPVSDKTLMLLFNTARFMVFPSLFEGLGLPLIEAVQQDLPIIASNSTCIPEVLGDTALLFDGNNVDSVFQTLLNAIENPDLLHQKTAQYPAILEKYSWDKAVKTFIACYRFAAGRSLTIEDQSLLDKAIGE